MCVCVIVCLAHFTLSISILTHEMLNEARTIYSILYSNGGIIYFLVEFDINWPDFFGAILKDGNMLEAVKNVDLFRITCLGISHFFLCRKEQSE